MNTAPTALAPAAPPPARCGFRERLGQFVRFCVVGASGVFIDMSLLYLLVEVWRLPWDLRILKACAAEVALLGNFAGNHLWTFGRATSLRRAARPVLRHLWRFHAICGAGIVLAAVLLHFFHLRLGLNLYLANAVAIVLVTLWNFGLNARLNWRGTDR